MASRKKSSKAQRMKQDPSFRKITPSLGEVRVKGQPRYFRLRTGQSVEPKVAAKAVSSYRKRVNYGEQLKFWVKGLSREIDRKPELVMQLVNNAVKKGEVSKVKFRGSELVRKTRVPRMRGGEPFRVRGRVQYKTVYVPMTQGQRKEIVESVVKRFKTTQARAMVDKVFKATRKRKAPPVSSKLVIADIALFDKWMVVLAKRLHGMDLDLGFAETWREIGT